MLPEKVRFSSKVPVNSGQKRVVTVEGIKDLNIVQRTTFRSISNAIDVTLTSLHRDFKSGKFRRVNFHSKPLLTPSHKLSRLIYCLQQVNKETGRFSLMHNVVHIDEKWFFLTKVRKTYYLLPDEILPQEFLRHRNFIGKIMFLVAVAQPRWNHKKKPSLMANWVFGPWWRWFLLFGTAGTGRLGPWRSSLFLLIGKRFGRCS